MRGGFERIEFIQNIKMTMREAKVHLNAQIRCLSPQNKFKPGTLLQPELSQMDLTFWINYS